MLFTKWRSVPRRPSWWQTTTKRSKEMDTSFKLSRTSGTCAQLRVCWGCHARNSLQDSTIANQFGMTGIFLPVPSYELICSLLPCHIHLPVGLWNIEPHSQEEYVPFPWDKMLSQDSMHFIQRPCYQRRFSRQSEDIKSSLTIVKRHKLQWYGRVSHWSGLAKTMCQGTVKGRGRQGRQRRLWEDNIREWTGLEFAKSQREEEKCRNLLARLSVVPNDPRG